MNIITELNRKITSHMSTCLEKAVEERTGLTGMVESTLALVREMGREMIEEMIRTAEESLLNSKERSMEWVVQSRNREKTVSTLLGDICYQRTYYKNRESGAFRHLTDDLLGLEPHARMDTGLQSDMLTKAKEISYEQVVQSYDDISIRSRSTVKNLVHRTSMENTNWPNLENEKRKVRFLYVEADEDHVHQQRGKGMIMKLGYVHEGKHLVNPACKSKHKRNELIGAKYITGLYPNNDDFWFEVLDYIEAQYDLDYVERIFLSGDGAPWIQAGEDILPKCSFVIDGYHLSKYIKSATGPYPAYEKKLKNYVYRGMKDFVEAYFETIESNEHTQLELKRFASCKTYILGNWESIQNRNKEGYLECSAEGHISHVLSHRLSSRPLSWSKNGSETIAKLRVFTRNGGSISQLLDSSKEQATETPMHEVLDRKTIKRKKKIYEEFSSNITILDMGKRTNMFKLLKKLRTA